MKRQDRVRRYVNYHASRKKILDKRKLYYSCINNIPVCKNMTYNSFVGILRTMPTIEADSKRIMYVGNKNE